MRIRGIEIELHEDEDLSNHIRRTRDFFESDILDYLTDHHPVHGTIVDIGANIGNHSIYFANFLTYDFIVSIEPVPENYELLKKNMAPYHSVGLLNFAVSATSHPNFGMTIKRDNMGASYAHVDGELRVNAVSVDRLGFTDVTLMKIDVEEHEPAVLNGAMDTIQICKPLILIEDWHNKYAALLPDYELEKGWPEHHTFLYRWKHA